MLSFWFAKNILLDAKERTEIFRTNSAVNRIFKIQNSIDSVSLISLFKKKKKIVFRTFSLYSRIQNISHAKNVKPKLQHTV